MSIAARDGAINAEVQDMCDYGHDDIVFGMRYIDAVLRDEAARTTADLSRVRLIEPDEARLTQSASI